MALESALESLRISDRLPDCLPFKPAASRVLTESESARAYEAVPRYLFRVISPKSQGENNEIWQRSQNAALMNGNGMVDIFAMDRPTAAEMLNAHLRWRHEQGDNLISWTSSQLYAASYIVYLRDCCKLDLKDIKLGVIDTTGFPSGTFLRDLELIKAFRSSNSQLNNLAELRERQRKYYNGFFYFGEYLCQGSLRVAGSCQFIDASALVANGLYTLRPELQERSEKWAKRVISLREDFYSTTTSTTTEQQLGAVIDIAQLFEPRWRLPIATCLLALRPRNSDDSNILHALNPHILKWREGFLVENSSLVLRGVGNRDIMNFAFETKVVSHDYLPEVEQVQRLLLALQVDCSVSKLLNNVRYARKCIQCVSHRSRSSRQPGMLRCQTTIQETRYNRIRSYIHSLRNELSQLEDALPQLSDGVRGFDETEPGDNVSDPDLEDSGVEDE